MNKLIIYAHGYVIVFEPLALPQEAAAYVPLFTLPAWVMLLPPPALPKMGSPAKLY